jgi:hypothetical protein
LRNGNVGSHQILTNGGSNPALHGQQALGVYTSNTPAKRSFVPRSALRGAARNVSQLRGFSQVWDSDEVERLRLWQGLMWRLTEHGYAKRCAQRLPIARFLPRPGLR